MFYFLVLFFLYFSVLSIADFHGNWICAYVCVCVCMLHEYFFSFFFLSEFDCEALDDYMKSVVPWLALTTFKCDKISVKVKKKKSSLFLDGLVLVLSRLSHITHNCTKNNVSFIYFVMRWDKRFLVGRDWRKIQSSVKIFYSFFCIDSKKKHDNNNNNNKWQDNKSKCLI